MSDMLVEPLSMLQSKNIPYSKIFVVQELEGNIAYTHTTACFFSHRPHQIKNMKIRGVFILSRFIIIKSSDVNYRFYVKKYTLCPA